MRAQFILYALCLIHSCSVSQDLTKILIDGKWCDLEGTAKSNVEKQLNRNKNRFTSPSANDIDQSITLQKLLMPGNDENRFDTARAAVIEGYVIDVMIGGCSKFAHSQGETCNCNTINPKICDTHIVLGLGPGVPNRQTIIVEITERMRLLHKNEDWSTDALKLTLKNRYVRFMGWLTFDFAHLKQAENTNPGDPKNWRATCWELHPVTDFTIVKSLVQ